MATIKQIKEQQESVKSIYKITSAMQLVATAKSQRAIKALQGYQSYYMKLQNIVGQIIEGTKKQEDFKGTYWVIIMSDLGLAGGYNSKIVKSIVENIDPKDKVLALGSKGSLLRSKMKNELEVHEAFDFNNPEDISALQLKIQNSFTEEKLKVKVIYTKFISQLEFEPQINQVLPIEVEKPEIEATKKTLAVTEFEPDKEELLKEIEDVYIQSIMIGLFREAQASEHTSRRTAMENASRNGEDLLKELNVVYNRTRQAKITQEISEIIGGAEAQK